MADEVIFCPEGRMCCGKQTEVRAKYAKLKEEAV